MSQGTTPSRSPVPTPTQANSVQMANPLLNLLKFGPNPASPQSNPPQQAAAPSRSDYPGPSTHSVHGRGISASDLVASFTGAKASTPAQQRASSSSSTNHQDALLRLLNQTTARSDSGQQKGLASLDTSRLSEDPVSSSLDVQHPSAADSPSGRTQSPIRLFGSKENTPTPFEPFEPRVSPGQQGAQKSGMFTYVNPFEQLAASSPRIVRNSPHADRTKRSIKSPSPADTQSSTRRKLTPSGSEILQSIESPIPTRLDDGRTQVEALMGIGAPTKDAETVAEALNEVGEKVDQQMDDALAKAEEKAYATTKPCVKLEPGEETNLNEIKTHASKVADYVQAEPAKGQSQGLLEASTSKPGGGAAKAAIDESAQTRDERRHREKKTNPMHKQDRTVKVFQFPMKPFVHIDLIQSEPAELSIREDSIVNIARFKKDFDQADRTLATASNDYIAYAMPKNGGVRIIRQEDGVSSLVFSSRQDRIFNISLCTGQPGSSSPGTQTMLATGVSGTIYWTTIAVSGEQFSQEEMDKQGLMIPPISNQSDSTSGGQLKTRAKKSNRHPEYFAIGRGKSIQIIFSSHARNSELVTKEGLMDTEKYYNARSLKITTGKAGKDFAFSEDDTVIASLDKAGKLRLWDIRDLIDDSMSYASLLQPVEVKTPMLTFSTAHLTEKSWPTSVLFVDKVRAYVKGTAHRYVLVGMKQNHTLQLWDLCLGKAVQELSFPHQSENDAICSLAYHPTSGIIVVGHPTRNSIYLIHLSAPKYNLPSISQATLVQRLANNDSTLPKADATAIMSGIREYSLSNLGQLRSFELVPASGEVAKNEDEDPLFFELYVMHSKGVTCLGIKREDLGWSTDSKVLHPVESEKEGFIIVKDLREASTPPNTEPPTDQSPVASIRAKTTLKEAVRVDRLDIDKAAPVTAEKSDKKKNKRNGATDPQPLPSVAESSAQSYATASGRTPSPTKPAAQSAQSATKSAPKESSRPSVARHASHEAPNLPNGDSISVGISGDFLDKELKKIETSVSKEFNKVLGKELDTIYRRFAEDKRVQEAAGAAKQDAILRLVSSTLGENVEHSLSRIVQKNIQDSVVPSISASLNDKLSLVVAKQVNDVMPNVMKQALPEAVSRTMQSPNVLSAITEQVTKAVTGHVEEEFSTVLHHSIVPTFTDLATNVAQKVSREAERRVREQLQHAELQHREDSVKIDQLTNLVRGLSETIHTMAAAQSDFQVEILKLQRASQVKQPSVRHSPTPSESASMHVSPEQEELDAVSTSMNEGRFEEATVMWLQSGQQVALFDNLFVRCNPGYLRNASPLVVLSVGAAVTASLTSNVLARLEWLETVLGSIDPRVRYFYLESFRISY